MSDHDGEPPQQPPDHDGERGLVVFTAAHHFARGFCRGSRCRHGHFRPPPVEGNTRVDP